MVPYRIHFRAAVCFLFLFFWMITAPADASGKEISIAPGQACDSAGCHADLMAKKHVHPALETGDCDTCHEQQGSQHIFTFPAEGNELCGVCHEPFGDKKNQHPALEMGCTSCHNPHASDTKFMLEAPSLMELCFTCHDESLVEKKWTHGPASAGECTACHDPHESDNPKLLIETPPALCFKCHSEAEEAINNDKVVHGAIDAGCTACHNPHSEENPFFLGEPVPNLCFECHSDIEETVTNATVKHGIIEQGKRCLNCHQPHTSAYARLLKVSPSDICFDCHNKVIESSDGPLKNMKEWVEEHEYVHPPAMDGECVNCHQPHGSTHYRLLNANYPSGFYAPYSDDTYALCFNCHDDKLARFEKTTKQTNFRDGALNLHYRHVNKPRKGRVCTACHDPHASNSQKQIKEETQFGSWQMPIRFEKTETGGSCYPGCHERKAYDRENPVLGKSASETAQ